MDKNREQRARAARSEAAARARRKQAMRKWIALGGAGAVGLAVVAVMVVNGRADSRERDRLEATLSAGDCRSDTKHDPESPETHVPSPSYEVNPPAGGDHTPQAAANGVFGPDSVPPDGPVVHAMEHGFVVLWYDPDLEEAAVDEIKEVAATDPQATLVVPRPSLDGPVAATAWHRRLLCESVDAEALTAFIDAYRDKGPEGGFVEPRRARG